MIGLLNRWMTNNPRRRASVHEMARHLPPGGAALKVIDVGSGNAALQLLEYRPDLRILAIARRAGTRYGDCVAWAQGDLTRLPVRDNGVDAVTAHSVYDVLEGRPAFLGEALRVLRPGGRLIMFNPAERAFPFRRLHQRFTLEEVAAHLDDAGFARILSERVADGYGILSRGEKPYPNLSTVERIAQTAARDAPNQVSQALQVVDAGQLGEAFRGRFVYLLLRQTPDKPAWALQSGEPIRWQAAMVNDEREQPYLVVFTSLSKAVEFMQPAVTSGVLHGINKVAKFEKSLTARWSADALINPQFEILRASSRFTFKGVQMDVDPASAVSGEE